MTLNEGTTKTTPHLEGSLGDKDLGGNIPPADMELIHTPVADPLGTSAKYQVDETQSTRLRYRSLTKIKGKTSSEVEPDTEPLKTQTYADIQAFLLSNDELDKESDEEEEQHEEAAVSYADLKAYIDQYYDENIAHRYQTDKLVEASMSSLNRRSTTISDLYKGLDFITQLLKDINTAVKDDLATNQKINEATETFAKISSNITEQEESSTIWMKKDTFEIKSMMNEMYAAFRGQSSSAPSSSITPTFALTDIQANVKGENANTTATKEPPSHTEGETEEPKLAIPISSIPSTKIPPTQAQPITSIIIHPESSQATPKIDKGKGIATESNDDPSKKLVKASSIVRPDLDEPVRVEFMTNGKTSIEDEEVSLVDGVLEGALGALGDEIGSLGDGVVVSSWVKSTNNYFGRMMLIFGLLETFANRGSSGGHVGLWWLRQ
ncbi:hypothetical protein Tco_0834997 [Tanacetum coccineum]